MKYKIESAFGGKLLASARTMKAARSKAIKFSREYPVHIWTTTGGLFGIGKVVAGYNKGVETTRAKSKRASNPRQALSSQWKPCQVRRLPNGRIQVKVRP